MFTIKRQPLTRATSIPIFDEHGVQFERFSAIVDEENTNKVFNVATNRYTVVQHQDLVDATKSVLGDLSCKHKIVKLTDAGRRMYAEIDLPTVKHDVGRVGDIVNLRVGIHNTYDGSGGVRIEVYGHRLVCSNGLFLPHSFSRFHKKHLHGIDMDALKQSIVDGVSVFKQDFVGVLEKYIEDDLTEYKAIEFVDECMENKVIPIKYLETIKTRIETRDGVDTVPVRNKWDLYNTITEVMTHANTSIFHQVDSIRRMTSAMDQFKFAA